MSSNSNEIFSSTPRPHPFNELPGDPSLMLVTNVDLGEKKIDIMKKCSKVISKHTGKPEAYIGVFQSTTKLVYYLEEQMILVH